MVIVMLFSLGLAKTQSSDFDISQFYPIDASHSYLGFSIKYMGYAKVKGRFEKFKGSFRYDENDLGKTSVSFTVDVASIDTDNDWRDKDLRSANWFDIESYPQMHFISHLVEEADEGFNLIGELTIKDVTKTVTIKMEPPSGVLKDIRGDLQVIFNGGFKLNRKDFGVEGKNWSKVKEGITAVGEEVDIELTMLGKQIQKNNFKNWVGGPERPQGKLYQIAANEGVEEALKVFEEMKADSENPISAAALGMAASMFLKEEKVDIALKLFEANLKAFPDDARVYDSYAEALAWAGNLEEAAKYYKMALEKDPDNTNAGEVLRHLSPN
mgnify:CR=1 FL=1